MMERLSAILLAALKAEGLLKPGLRVLCALSGGADSVALLHAAHTLQKELGFSLYAVHVQHNLRGQDSLADEAFVRQLCSGLSIPLTVEEAGLQGSMEDAGMETRARDARREIFARRMRALDASVLLTAHHRDDQTETALMHLLRGSGLKGISGMSRCVPFADGALLRPFLELPKQELLSALEAAGLPHREDASNQQAVTPRNELRLTLLPRMEAIFPGASAHIAQFSRLAGEDERYLEAEADKLYQSSLCSRPPLFALKREPLLAAPPALSRRALRRWYMEGLRTAALSPDERSLSCGDTQALLDALLAGGSVNLPCGLAAVCGHTHIHLLHQDGSPLMDAPAPEPLCIHPDRAEYHLSHALIRQEAAQAGDALPRSADDILLSPALLAQKPVLRTPLPGDFIRPFGAPGAKPLRRYLTDRKVDLPFRAVLPVLAVGAEVLWIPSLCASEALRLLHVPDGAIRLTLPEPLPFLPNDAKE